MNTIHESTQIDTAMQLKNEQETSVLAKKDKKRINTHVRYGIDYSVFEGVLELCNQDDKLAIQYLDKLRSEVGLVFLSVQDAIECTKSLIESGMNYVDAIQAHVDRVNSEANIVGTIEMVDCDDEPETINASDDQIEKTTVMMGAEWQLRKFVNERDIAISIAMFESQTARRKMYNDAMFGLHHMALSFGVSMPAPSKKRKFFDAWDEWRRYSDEVLIAVRDEPKQEAITADEFADTIMQKIESIDDLLDEQKKEALTRLKTALNELDTPIDMEIAEYIGEALNDRTRLCILLNIRALREFIKNSIKDHANGIAITIPKPKKVQCQKSFNVEHIRQLKLADQKIKKSNTTLNAKTIGMIKYEITDSGLEVTLKNNFGIKSSKFIRKYLKGKGLKRIGRTIEHGVCFKPELVDEIIADLGIDGVEKEIPNFDMSDINLHYVPGVNDNASDFFACHQT